MVLYPSSGLSIQSLRVLVLPFLLAVIALQGCAFGHTVPYAGTVARIDASGGTSVAVTAHDQRKRVVERGGSPTFVGELRSLAHIPYGVYTASGKPLADDLTTVLAASFASKGFKVVPVVVTHSEKPETVIQKVTAGGVERAVVLTVVEWRTDTYFKTQLFYDFNVRILDQNGKQLAEGRLDGHIAELVGPPTQALRQMLERLLNEPKVANAIASNVRDPPASTPAPVTNQPSGTAPSESDVADQLQRLKELHEKGLITEDIYKEKMKQILNRL